YAALTSCARTEQPNALVDHVTALLPEDKPQRARGAYADTSKQWRRGLEGSLGDRLRAQKSEKTKGWVFRSLRAGSFTGGEINYRAFTHVKDGLIELGLVDIKDG
ncbi:MAG TPA: hypothetical protein VI756_18110, partial [Blastocatellia bacterium]